MNPTVMWLFVAALLIGVFFLMEKTDYSIPLYIILAAFLIGGTYTMLYTYWIIGAPFFVLSGTAMLIGVKGPKSTSEDKSSKVWVVTFRGKLTDVVVDSASLFLEWPLDIIGHVEQDMKLEDFDLDLSKPLICTDGVPVTGKFAIALRANGWGPDRAEQLRHLFNAGGIDGVKKQLDDILTVLTEEKYTKKYPSTWIERNSRAIEQGLAEELENGNLKNSGFSDSLSNAIGFGVTIVKLAPELKVPDAINKERENIAVEKVQQEKERIETQTRILQAEDYLAAYRRHMREGDPDMTLDQALEWVNEQQQQTQGREQTIKTKGSGKGITVAEIKPS